MKHERNAHKNSAQMEDSAIKSPVEEPVSTFENLAAGLTEIRKLKGVIGYILRNQTSAIVDVSEQEKIPPYALLSNQIRESSMEMAKLLNLGELKSVLIEGKNIKVVCMGVGENAISIFLEKGAPHSWIVKRMLL